MEKLPKTIKEAREKGTRLYFTGKPCLRGHITERYTKNSNCLGCNSFWKDKFKEEDEEAYREYNRAAQEKYREKHGEEWREYQREYQKNYYRKNNVR